MLAIVIGMKLVGSLCVIGSGVGLGIVKSRELENKVKDVNELDRALTMLENEIGYRRNDLLHAFENLATNTDNVEFKKLFSRMSEVMRDERLGLVEAIQKLQREVKIDKKVYKEMETLFKNIGSSNVDGEMKNIKATQNQLDLIKAEYIDFNNKYRKVYNAGGGLLGTVLTLLLL